jgi:hypothetical protein
MNKRYNSVQKLAMKDEAQNVGVIYSLGMKHCPKNFLNRRNGYLCTFEPIVELAVG